MKEQDMDSATAPTVHPWRFYVWLASAILITALALGIAAGLYADRYLTIEAASKSTEQSAALTGVIVDQTLRDIDTIVAGLQMARAMQPREFAASVRAKARWIERELDQRAAVRAYAIIDQDGTVISASLPELLGQSRVDRSYFSVHRDGRVPGLYVTDPFISSVTRYRLFLVSWPLRAPDRSFLGVLAISFDTDEIASVIGAMTKPVHDTVALIKTNGTILATSHRENTQAIDPDYNDAGLQALLNDPALAAGAEVRQAAIFGRSSQWISVVRALTMLDGAIVIARDLDAVLAMWRWRAVAFVGGGALLIASMLACAMVLSRLLDRQQTALAAASHDALTDPLTGLFNRRMFHEWATTEWSRSRRQGTRLSLLVLDIDHFKHINDTFGHAAGDQVLIGITSCLRSLIRKEDLIARVGGEEFAIIMPNLSLADASGFAERLRAGVEVQQLFWGKSTIGVTISIGVAEAQHGPTPIETALSAADIALYRAKQQGRNRVVVAGVDGDTPPRKSGPFTVVEGKKAAS